MLTINKFPGKFSTITAMVFIKPVLVSINYQGMAEEGK